MKIELPKINASELRILREGGNMKYSNTENGKSKVPYWNDRRLFVATCLLGVGCGWCISKILFAWL